MADRPPFPGEALIFDGENWTPGGEGQVVVPPDSFPGNRLSGVRSGLAAISGQVGEYLETLQATPVAAAATTIYLALMSLNLSVGDWDVSGWVESIPNGATPTVDGATELVIGTTTASASGSTIGYDRVTSNHEIVTGARHQLVVPRKRVLTAVAVTLFVNVMATYSAGTPQWVGSISARRMR